MQKDALTKNMTREQFLKFSLGGLAALFVGYLMSPFARLSEHRGTPYGGSSFGL
ncbi:hypothetical protein GVX82_04290 [Patescibacteria group bacterium]|jgi:hypothetical protein|nr:hypothetical protein [Patescibacteria group bacterium]